MPTPRTGAADASIQLPASGTQNPLDAPYLVAQQPGVPTAVPPGVPVRRLTLNEGFDAYGRLLQQIGTDQPVSGTGTRVGSFPSLRRGTDGGRERGVRRGVGNPAGLPFSVPPSPRTGGNEYVWHCHILEHEEHDMMRPLIVT